MIDRQLQSQQLLQRQRRCPSCGQIIGGGGQKPRPLPKPGIPTPRPKPGMPRPLPKPIPTPRPKPGMPRPLPERGQPVRGRFPEQPIRRTLPWKPKPRPWKKELYERKRREEGRARLR